MICQKLCVRIVFQGGDHSKKINSICFPCGLLRVYFCVTEVSFMLSIFFIDVSRVFHGCFTDLVLRYHGITYFFCLCFNSISLSWVWTSVYVCGCLSRRTGNPAHKSVIFSYFELPNGVQILVELILYHRFCSLSSA